MSTWFYSPKGLSVWMRKLARCVLAHGPLPKHVAFIMDGNRRFARKRALESCRGHSLGFEKLTEVLEWCKELGILEVTVYALSIENFKRSAEEVEFLMKMAIDKVTLLLEEKDKLMEHGLCVRVLGNMGLLPEELQRLVANVVELTRENKGAFLNVCLAYTARDDICRAVDAIREGCERGLIDVEDVDAGLIESCLTSWRSPRPDLLIRTSGELRLSDFLLWESSYSQLYFANVLWPELGWWDFYKAIISYQTGRINLDATGTGWPFSKYLVDQPADSSIFNSADSNPRINHFLRTIRSV